MNLLDNLSIPIPYLIQKKTDFNFLDSFGWSLMHYAVGLNNADKINELLLCDIDFNNNSSTNKILTNCLMTCGKDDMGLYSNIDSINIPYCENGYTPIHLSVFLHKYYKKRLHSDYRKYSTSQIIIFENFLKKFPEAIKWEDSNNLTITDYCILSLNFEYLMKIKKIDANLESLSKVNPLTAKKICENELERNVSNKDSEMNIEELNFMKEMVDFFRAKHSKDLLETQLKEKKQDKSVIIKI